MNINEELLADDHIMANWPAGICQPEQNWDKSKPVLVILASCHGRQLLTYFNMKHEFRSKFNVVRLETGPIYLSERANIPAVTRPSVKRLLNSADVLLTYNMGPVHGSFSLDNISSMLKSDCKIVTFAAPNCSIFWPVSQNYCGVLAVMHALDNGMSEAQIIQDFEQGTFNPLFSLRWRLEMGRIEYRDKTHDVKLLDFIKRNYRSHKLFMSPGHPSFNTIAWLGSGLIRYLGYNSDAESTVLSYDYLHDSMAVFPETRYEFNHFQFQYPLRHESTSMGGREVYLGLIRDAVAFNNAGGFCSIPMD